MFGPEREPVYLGHMKPATGYVDLKSQRCGDYSHGDPDGIKLRPVDKSYPRLDGDYLIMITLFGPSR